MKLIRTEYQVENNVPVIYLFCREDNKRTIKLVSDFVPYFYIPANEIDVLRGIRHDEQTYRAVDKTEVSKVYVTLPEDVPQLRDKFTRTFESDVLFPIRYNIDMVDTIEPTVPKTLFIDIETDNHGKIPSAQLSEEAVLCVSVYDNLSDSFTTLVWRGDTSPGVQTKEFDGKLHEVEYFRSEEEMLKRLVGLITAEEPDVITGWYCTQFDLPYLFNRMKRLKINSNPMSPMGTVYMREGELIIKGCAIVDLIDVYKRFNQNMEESYQLDFIGQKVAGVGKNESGSNVRWLWMNDLDRLISYNTNDTLITAKIDEKQRLTEFLDELRRMSFINLEDALTTTRLADGYILRLFHNKIVFPTRQHQERAEFEGAFVGSWARGVYEDVAVFDVRSLYPSIVVSANLSSDTIVQSGGDIHVNNVHTVREPKGFLPQTIEHLFEERGKYRKLMNECVIDSPEYKLYYGRQYALKTLLNSLYGQCAYPNSRIYNPKIAETVTYMGRRVIGHSKAFFEELGYKVLYCDTDSTFVEFPGGDIEEIQYVLKLLNESYSDFVKEFGIIEHRFSMEFEKVCKRAFFGTAKKRYALYVTLKEGKQVDTIQTMGFETRRSDASRFSRNLMERVFTMLLKENKNKEEVLRYIGSEISRLREGKFTFSEIGIPKGITKELDRYGKEGKGIPSNIRATKYALEVLGHELTNKPKLLYVSKMPNGLADTDVLAFDEDTQVPAGTQLDIEKTIEKIVKDKLDSIFEALDWKMSDLQWYWHSKSKKEGEQVKILF